MLILPIEQATSGVKLATSVFHPDSPDTELLKAGFVCDATVLKRLRDMGVTVLCVDYPGFEELDKYLAPQLTPSRQLIYSQIKNTIAAVEKTAQPTVGFADYYASTRDLIITLMQQGENAFFLEELCRRMPGDEVAHSTSVAHLSLMMGIRLEQYLIAQRSRLSVHHAREVTNLGVAGMLHDIGKTKLPEHLRTRHQVNAGEKDEHRAAWEEHPQVGFEMVRNGIEASASAAIRQHHQRFDGSGYPQLQRTKGPPSTLAGNDIHVFARLLAAADLFDRLVVDREGRRRANVVVLHLMREKFAPWFDPQVIETMPSVIPPFPPGMQVQLSDGTTAIVVDLDRDHPYEPKVRRIATGSLAPDGDVVNLRRVKDLRIVSINQVNVEAMYPAENKVEKTSASHNAAPVAAADVAVA